MKTIFFCLFLLFNINGFCKEDIQMEFSEYVQIVTTVPETHADIVRDAMGKAGAGIVGDYSYCSFSVKGIGRFMPLKGANPFIGKEGVLEEVIEERIETICAKNVLEHVLDAIKKAHPYEETVIYITPFYEMGRKTTVRK